MKDRNPQQPSPSAGRPRPTSAQIWRQIGVILLVVGFLAGLFIVYLNLTGERQTTAPASPPPTQAAAPIGGPTTAPPAPASPTPTAAPIGGPTTAPPTAASPTPTAHAETPTVSFARDVLPLLQARCEGCHGASQARAGFAVSSYGSVMAGSNNGPVITPGNSATSRLVDLIVSGKMPRGAPRLSDSEIGIIRAWIDQGALDN